MTIYDNDDYYYYYYPSNPLTYVLMSNQLSFLSYVIEMYPPKSYA